MVLKVKLVDQSPEDPEMMVLLEKTVSPDSPE